MWRKRLSSYHADLTILTDLVLKDITPLLTCFFLLPLSFPQHRKGKFVVQERNGYVISADGNIGLLNVKERGQEELQNSLASQVRIWPKADEKSIFPGSGVSMLLASCS